jgi:hypothetical protein
MTVYSMFIASECLEFGANPGIHLIYLAITAFDDYIGLG